MQDIEFKGKIGEKFGLLFVSSRPTYKLSFSTDDLDESLVTKMPMFA